MERPKRKRRILKFRDFQIDESDYRALNMMLNASAGNKGGCTTLADAVARCRAVITKKNNNEDELRSFLSGFPPLVRAAVSAIAQSCVDNADDEEEFRVFPYGFFPLEIWVCHRAPKKQRKLHQAFEMDDDDAIVFSMLLARAWYLRENKSPDELKKYWGDPFDTVEDVLGKTVLYCGEENNKDKRITVLGITGYHFCDGVLPHELLQLDALEDLRLQLEDFRAHSGRSCIHLQFPPHEYLCTLRNLKSLQILRSNIAQLPPEIFHLQNLESLCIGGATMKSIPDAIVQLSNLKVLALEQCDELQCLPHDIGSLGKLETLQVFCCGSLTKIPDSINRLSSLEILRVTSCAGLTVLPEALGGLSNLKECNFRDCKNLTMLPDSIGGLTNLKMLVINFCPRLTVLPATLGDLIGLEELLCLSDVQQLPEELANLTKLKRLDANTRAPLTAAAIGTLTRLISNQLNLEELAIHHSCFGKLEQDTFSTKGTLKRLHLFKGSEPNDIKLPSIPSVEELCIYPDLHGDDDKVFILDTIGHCPSLKNLHIGHYRLAKSNIAIQISHRSPLLFPAIQEVKFHSCKVKLVGMPTSNQEEILPMVSTIETITMEKSEFLIPKCNDLLQKLHIDSMPHLNNLVFSVNRDLEGLPKHQFEQMMVAFLSRSPGISSLDFKDCGISELPPKAISLMPEKLLRLDLSSNPIFKTISGLESICSVLQRCKLLVDIGSLNDGREAVESLLCFKQVGCLLSLNRAHSRILMGQRIAPALWPLALEKAPGAFKLPRDIGFNGIEEGPDSIYLLLRKRAAVEVIVAM